MKQKQKTDLVNKNIPQEWGRGVISNKKKTKKISKQCNAAMRKEILDWMTMEGLSEMVRAVLKSE